MINSFSVLSVESVQSHYTPRRNRSALSFAPLCAQDVHRIKVHSTSVAQYFETPSFSTTRIGNMIPNGGGG